LEDAEDEDKRADENVVFGHCQAGAAVELNISKKLR